MITITFNLLGVFLWLGIIGAIVLGILALVLGSMGLGITAIICGCVAALMFIIALTD